MSDSNSPLDFTPVLEPRSTALRRALDRVTAGIDRFGPAVTVQLWWKREPMAVGTRLASTLELVEPIVAREAFEATLGAASPRVLEDYGDGRVEEWILDARPWLVEGRELGWLCLLIGLRHAPRENPRPEHLSMFWPLLEDAATSAWIDTRTEHPDPLFVGLLEATPHPVIVVDEDHHVVATNHNFDWLLGIFRDETLTTLEEVLPESHVEFFADALEKTLRGDPEVDVPCPRFRGSFGALEHRMTTRLVDEGRSRRAVIFVLRGHRRPEAQRGEKRSEATGSLTIVESPAPRECPGLRLPSDSDPAPGSD